MDPVGILFGIAIALVLVAVALYFGWRQRLILSALRFETNKNPEHRRYLIKQCTRRLFGSLLLLVLAGMMVGLLFLDFNPEPGADPEQMRQAVRFPLFYVMSMMLVLMVILVLAVVDFWATARFSFQQQRQLLQEHQQMLAAELMERKARQAELN